MPIHPTSSAAVMSKNSSLSDMPWMFLLVPDLNRMRGGEGRYGESGLASASILNNLLQARVSEAVPALKMIKRTGDLAFSLAQEAKTATTAIPWTLDMLVRL